jgi:hypothetical protein
MPAWGLSMPAWGCWGRRYAGLLLAQMGLELRPKTFWAGAIWPPGLLAPASMPGRIPDPEASRSGGLAEETAQRKSTGAPDGGPA